MEGSKKSPIFASYLHSFHFRKLMKYCPQCGTQLPDDAKFCYKCGNAASSLTSPPPVQPTDQSTDFPPPPPTPPPAPTSADVPPPAPAKKKRTYQRRSIDNEQLKQGVQLCADGKYRWIYPFNMWTNPTILFLVYKVFIGIGIGIGILITILNWRHISWEGWEKLWDETWPVLAFIGFFGLLIFIAYAMVAAMYGGKYIILFTMDENGINHEQIPEQAKKARKLGMLTAGAGAAGGNLSSIGLGISVANRTSMYSDFKSVRSVKKGRWGHVIKIREILSNNQVYVRDEDFDFVYNYIKEHCPRVK